MFEYKNDGGCRFMPHVRLKGKKPFRITKENSACSVWVLHCSTSTENVLYGGDMFRMADATGGDWDVVGTDATLFMAEEQWTSAPHAVGGHAYVHRFNVQVG